MDKDINQRLARSYAGTVYSTKMTLKICNSRFTRCNPYRAIPALFVLDHMTGVIKVKKGVPWGKPSKIYYLQVEADQSMKDPAC